MIAADTAKGKRIALFGLGGSGLVTARSLLAGGADIVCFDDNPASVERAAAEGIPTGDLRDAAFSAIDELVLAPGVPLTIALVMAREVGIDEPAIERAITRSTDLLRFLPGGVPWLDWASG